MTPLLTRLARRAAGLPLDPVVVAAPVLPARFEPVGAETDATGVAAPDATPPVVAEQRVRTPASPAQPQDADRRPAAAAPVPGVPERPPRPGPVARAVAAEPVYATPAPPSVAQPGERTPAVPAAPPSRLERPTVVHRAARIGSLAAPTAPTAPRVNASPVVEAAPPRRATDAPHGRGRPEPAAREPDVVHVTIGRVEVRGPAPAPPPALPSASAGPRGATGPEPLSLGDYLRGRREAR